MSLIAIHTKSNGWVPSTYEYEPDKFLVFSLQGDKTISVFKKELNPLVDGGFACSLSYNYPMEDVIDYVYEK